MVGIGPGIGKTLAAAGLAALTLAPFGGARMPAAQTTVTQTTANRQGADRQAADLEALRTTALEAVNEERRERDLAPLEFDDALNEAAQEHSEDMLRRGYYAHTSPEGGTVMDRYLAAGGSRARAVAENIAMCENCPPPDRPAVRRLTRGWMDSPEHRRNILDPGMDGFGFGIAAQAGAGLYATQTFAGAGAPRATQAGAEARPVTPEEQLSLALDLINQARRDAGVAALEGSPALSQAVRSGLPEDGLSGFSLDALDAPRALLPEDERDRWTSFSLVAGRCGGCGTRPTDTDVRFFVERWLGDPQYRNRLVDPAYTHAGMALAADGDGQKAGVAMLAGP